MLRSRGWYALGSLGFAALAILSAVIGGYAMDAGIGWLEELMVFLVGLGIGWFVIYLVRAVLPNRLRRRAFKPVPPELRRRELHLPRSLWRPRD